MTNIKVFVNEFNFANPNWDKLPSGFPNCNLAGLNQTEKVLFSGIVMAWQVTKGRSFLYSKTAKAVLTICFIGLISLINSRFGITQSFTKPVNAATVSASLRNGTTIVNEIIQSTRSAVLNK